MEFTLKINKLSDINKIKNVDTYLLTNKYLSLRYGFSIPLNKVQDVVSKIHKMNKKAGFIVNRIFFDSDLEMVKEALKTLIESKIDYIYFADFAIFQFLKEMGKEDIAVFFHETFVKSYQDLKSYQEIGFKNIVVSKDMNLDSIMQIDDKDNIGIICFGYIPLYFSKRAVIKNYCKINNLKINGNDKNLYVKEEKRDEFYHILEQNHIATIFAPYPLNYFQYFKKLANHIDNFIFDSLFIDVKTMKHIIDTYHLSLEKDCNLDDIKSNSLFLIKKDWEIS